MHETHLQYFVYYFFDFMSVNLFFIYAFLFDILDRPQTQYVANDDLEILPLSPKWWNYWDVSPCSAYVVLGTEARALSMLRMDSPCWNYILSLFIFILFFKISISKYWRGGSIVSIYCSCPGFGSQHLHGSSWPL